MLTVLKLRSLAPSLNRARSTVSRNAKLVHDRPLHRSVAIASNSTLSSTSHRSGDSNWNSSAAAFASLLTLTGAGAAAVALCDKGDEKGHLTPSHVASEDFGVVQKSHDIDTMPIYSSDQVAVNDGTNGTRMWMSYGGVVYDVTDFLPNHPGGSEKISMAAGTAIEPFWYLYRQHFASDLPMRLMEHMAVGRLAEEDQEAIDEQMTVLEEDDPYARDPLRHKALIVHSETPMNAEIPSNLMTKNYVTPASLFYIRHHHPVPYLTEKQLHDFRLQINLSAYGKGTLSLTMDDLKKLPKYKVTATLQCSGNRRGGFNDFKRTSGTPWGQGAVSTAVWGGVKLADLIELAGLEDAIEAQEKMGFEHVIFHGLDGMQASIGIEKALNPYGDVIVCYEMNGEPLPRDHGFPLRVIVPGYAAVRNVKWVNTIELSKTEATGAWQQGLNYKTLPPSVTDATNIKLDQMPSMTEVSLFSGITESKVVTGKSTVKPGDKVTVKTSGWAWSGGGRNIVRVDITSDGGKTWATADITEGKDQRFGRAWAWSFWECDVPAVVQKDGTVELASKAVDLAFNVQPESSDHGWNVRGLGNNAWHRVKIKAVM